MKIAFSCEIKLEIGSDLLIVYESGYKTFSTLVMETNKNR